MVGKDVRTLTSYPFVENVLKISPPNCVLANKGDLAANAMGTKGRAW